MVQAKNDDAARKALQDMFKDRDDVLSQNEQIQEGGGGDDSGSGSGGGGKRFKIHHLADETSQLVKLPRLV